MCFCCAEFWLATDVTLRCLCSSTLADVILHIFVGMVCCSLFGVSFCMVLEYLPLYTPVFLFFCGKIYSSLSYRGFYEIAKFYLYIRFKMLYCNVMRIDFLCSTISPTIHELMYTRYRLNWHHEKRFLNTNPMILILYCPIHIFSVKNINLHIA